MTFRVFIFRSDCVYVMRMFTYKACTVNSVKSYTGV